MAWDRRSPFNEHGGLMHWANPRATTKYDAAHEWRDEVHFEATLEVLQTVRGQSAAYLIVKDQDGIEHTMFITDLVDALPHFKKGKCKGLWVPQKRGQNFGFKLVKAL